MKLRNRPQKDGFVTVYDCGLVLKGDWASRLDQYEEYINTPTGKYILELEGIDPVMENFNKWNKIPEDVKGEAKLVESGDDTLHMCFVDDGCEGYTILVKSEVNKFSEKDITKIVQKYYIEQMDGEDYLSPSGYSIANISVAEVGRYGYDILRVE